eukprot:Rmarinus@m.29816
MMYPIAPTIKINEGPVSLKHLEHFQNNDCTFKVIIAVGVDISEQVHVISEVDAISILTGGDLKDITRQLPAYVNKLPPEFRTQWINWVTMGKGRLALWHRPTIDALRIMQEEGCDGVVTLQGSRERPEDVCEMAKQCGMMWWWVPLEGANQALLQKKSVISNVSKALLDVWRNIQEGRSVLLHCAAGIHRTGLFAYSLFRISGDDPDAAKSHLAEARLHTINGVGEHRLRVAEDLILPAVRERQSSPTYENMLSMEESAKEFQMATQQRE